jgi:toxin ParE1/3/4
VRIEFHPEALAEFQDAARYYADCQDNLGVRFITAVEAVLDRVEHNPQGGRIFEEDIRRCLTHVFPYAVLYSIEPDYLLIVAVMHCHREPGYWRHRVPSKP